MELLTDILAQAGVRRRILHRTRLPDREALQFPCDRSIGFHLVTDGEAFVHLDRKQGGPLRLPSGSVALMARACRHTLSSRREYDPASVRPMPLQAEAGGGGALLLSGAYQFWNTPVHPLFAEVPDWVVFACEAHPEEEHLREAIRLVERELHQPRFGSQRVIEAMLDVMFTLLLRLAVEQLGDAPGTWSYGIRQPQIRRAVELLHQDCAREWTLSELAREAGLSRAGLADKFRVAVGSTPGDYLRKVRMERAVRLLRESEAGLESVAAAVGYRDAFGFSKAFKRVVGVSPREFRTMDREDRPECRFD